MKKKPKKLEEKNLAMMNLGLEKERAYLTTAPFLTFERG